MKKSKKPVIKMLKMKRKNVLVAPGEAQPLVIVLETLDVPFSRSETRRLYQALSALYRD